MTNALDAVAFDASWVGTSGIGRFAAELLAQRPGWTPVNQNHRATNPAAPIRLGSAVRRSRERIDVVVSPGYMPPVGCDPPYAVTLHDLMYLEGGANYSRARAAYFRLIRHRLMRTNCVVLTVSDYSKRQIVEWTNGKVPVHVVGNGVSPIGPTASPTQRVTGHPPSILIVASERPNKNLAPQLRAADRALRSLGGTVEVVLPAPPTTALRQVLGSMRGNVILSVRLTDPELWERYRSADLLMTASLEEGFGLPAIEAMSVGCPVLYSDVGGLSEVVDGCGILVNPRDESSITNGVLRAIEDTDRTRRMVAAAYARSLDFTWGRVAQRVDQAISSLLT